MIGAAVQPFIIFSTGEPSLSLDTSLVARSPGDEQYMSRTAAVGEPKAHASHEVWPEWFESDPRWRLAQRVAASQAFVRSRLLSKFLLYIVAETLAERQSEITEHQIGVQVFDRPANYRSVEDNIVRTYARQLRRRMAEYFVNEGASETLRIEIPLGGYVPVFLPPAAEKVQVKLEGVPDTIAVAAPGKLAVMPVSAGEAATRRRGWKLPALLIGSLIVYSGLLVWLSLAIAGRMKPAQSVGASEESTSPLWAALFSGPANCYIVPADAGFNLLEDMTHRSLPLGTYVNGNYLNVDLPQMDSHTADDLRGQHFTSFVDLQTVTALARLPEFNPHRVIVRFPRDLQLDDLKTSNAILLGSMSSNPWAAIAESNANFRIVNGSTMQDAAVVNVKPERGESATYKSQWNQPEHETYAVIAYLPNLGGNGHLLLVQGLDVAGTQAAAEMLLHPAAMAPVLKKAGRNDGTLRSFEILLRSSSIESRSADAQIIGSRIY